MKRFASLSFIFITSVLCYSQSVYMHEAQEEALNSEPITLRSIIATAVFIGIIWLIVKVLGSFKDSIDNHHKVQEQKVKQFQESAVDLGLSVLWAPCNVGARSISSVGEVFAWGKTSKYERFCDALEGDSSKIGNISGNINYDVAAYRMGKGWRMPTKDEAIELIEKCKWEKCYNGIEGIKITGPNGNSIFIPFNGCRNNLMLDSTPNHLQNAAYLWLSTPNGKYSCSLVYNLDEKERFGCPRVDLQTFRSSGFGIRAVKNKE